jgi:hypothetical protein
MVPGSRDRQPPLRRKFPLDRVNCGHSRRVAGSQLDCVTLGKQRLMPCTFTPLGAGAALIARMMLVLCKLARSHEPYGRHAPSFQSVKAAQNDSCFCGSRKNANAVACAHDGEAWTYLASDQRDLGASFDTYQDAPWGR